MLFSGFSAVLLVLPLLANAFHNVTYNDNDPALIYRPASAWIDWPPAGCLSWPGGQYTHNSAGSITFNFYGVAVYVYGLFDDATNPIYTITINNGSPVEQGRGINASPKSCDPIFSKTGLTAGNHTVVFRMTDTRPDDVKDLSFQGFIVTVPDAADVTQSDETVSAKRLNVVLIAGAVGGGVVIILIILGVFCFCRSRKNKKKMGTQQMVGSAVPLVGQYQPQPMGDPSIPAPTPFILPPSREPSPYYPPTNSPWSPPPSSDNSTYYTGASQGQMQTPGHVAYAPPSPANDGYNRQYAQGNLPAHGNQPYYQPPTNSPAAHGTEHDSYSSPGGSYAMQQQQNTGYAGYPPQNQQQQQQPAYAWTAAPSSNPGSPPPTELSYHSRDEGSSSYAKPVPKEESQYRYKKGAVDPHAAPVVRNDNADLQRIGPTRESQGGEAPPPEYVPYS